MAKEANSSPTARRLHRAWRWWKRYLWPVVRHLIVPAVCILALMFGLAAGYTVLGDRPLSEVWKLETWKHMFDLVFSNT